MPQRWKRPRFIPNQMDQLVLTRPTSSPPPLLRRAKENSTMTRIRKDTVKRMIERGEMEARLSYSYDGVTVKQHDTFSPARMYDGNWDNRLDGYLNFNELLYSIWYTWRDSKDDTLINLTIASDEAYELRPIRS